MLMASYAKRYHYLNTAIHFISESWRLHQISHKLRYLSIYLYFYLSPGFSPCYLDFVLFLRCDCSHVALFICLLPVSIFRCAEIFVRGIAICLDEEARVGGEDRGRAGGEEGARLRDEYLQRAGKLGFFLAFSFPRIFVPVLRSPRTFARFLLGSTLRASRSLF